MSSTSETEQAAGDLVRRAGRIAAVMARHGVRFARGDANDPATMRARARGLRDALQELGPTFAKLGQILSTRPDLLPPVFIEELSALQENVAPLNEAEVVGAIEGALGVPWEDAFASIEPQPLAAGTIAQVHRATLENGEQVVIKVQRPGAAEQIRRDLDLLRLFAEKTAERASFRRMVDLPALTEHLARGLERELDFRNEAANMTRIREVLGPYERLQVPKVHGSFTGPTLLVVEYVDGVPLREAPEGPARRQAAKELLESYFKQILGEGFFHADPHPGNLRWYQDAIYFLDFGMVGELSEDVRDTLLLMMMALWQEDSAFIAEALLALAGPSESDRNIDAFVADLDALLKEHRHVSLTEGELGPLLTQLMTVALRHDVRLPAELALAGKALAQMQLAVAELDPDLDPFTVVGGYVSRHVLGQLRTSLSPGRMLYEASKARQRMSRIFLSLEGLLTGARDGRLKVQFRGTERLEETIGRVGRRLSITLVATAALVSTAVMSTSPEVPAWATATGAGIGGLFSVVLAWDVLRRR